MGSLDKQGRAANRLERPHRRVDAAGKESLGSLLQSLGSGADAGWEIWSHAGFSIEGDASVVFSSGLCAVAKSRVVLMLGRYDQFSVGTLAAPSTTRTATFSLLLSILRPN
jgi:hypothetical protein